MQVEVHELQGISSVVRAALDAGVFQLLIRSPSSASKCADKLDLNPTATALVLEALAALSLLENRSGVYSIPSTLALPGGRLRGDGGPPHADLWRHTGTFLRTGEPLSQMDAEPAEREKSYQDVVATLAEMFAVPAEKLARALKLSPRTILDIGCGAGVWGLAFAAAAPGSIVTGLDFPAVLAAFHARAREIGLASAAVSLEGDMNSVALGHRCYDLVIVANVLRLEPFERAKSLISRAGNSVAEDGTLLIVDALAGGAQDKDRARAFYALNLSMRTKAAKVHAASDYEDWLYDAGFSVCQLVDIESGTGALGGIVARRQ